MLACSVTAITKVIANPTIPKMGPSKIKPIIIVAKATNLVINTNLLFSFPNIFEEYSIVIASGITAMLMIAIASTASMNLGKNNVINFGKTRIPKIEIPIATIIVIFFKFLLDTPLASCGKRYLKTIAENMTKTVKI